MQETQVQSLGGAKIHHGLWTKKKTNIVTKVKTLKTVHIKKKKKSF